ncbi:protocatechuate 4,5-dioxygenase subunit alpha [Streptomyces sporangiiformans]|uniref:Protocatechuate 4,5-dioxygenase subunit alpha n=1 Tax=Streptomyces sporangiiformans TaxID=2315329 RepID=A0A505DQZ3_9ACTN|nr:protocatechuate 4,5-dioxygenase subunit alpha [Streptomyces sporangiiformans]TPQ23669.1 protocatechuate 4,5-dioxygenase subunit alpha [Streptomyces sporangiiformans]
MSSSTPQVPGTYVFDAAESRRGRALNRLCGSLKDAENRERFKADEAAYCDVYGLDAQQRDAVLSRDWTRMMDLGGSIFYVFKLAMVDEKSMQYLGGVFTGMTTEEFAEALRAGGRSFG